MNSSLTDDHFGGQRSPTKESPMPPFWWHHQFRLSNFFAGIGRIFLGKWGSGPNGNKGAIKRDLNLSNNLKFHQHLHHPSQCEALVKSRTQSYFLLWWAIPSTQPYFLLRWVITSISEMKIKHQARSAPLVGSMFPNYTMRRNESAKGGFGN